MLADCVEMIKGDMHVQDVFCTKLKSRYEHLYSLFHVVRICSHHTYLFTDSHILLELLTYSLLLSVAPVL